VAQRAPVGIEPTNGGFAVLESLRLSFTPAWIAGLDNRLCLCSAFKLAGGRVGATSARITPASVACSPASWRQNQQDTQHHVRNCPINLSATTCYERSGDQYEAKR
jgi:hypothetical protein